MRLKILVLLCVGAVFGCEQYLLRCVFCSSSVGAAVRTSPLQKPPTSNQTPADGTGFKPTRAFREYAARKLNVTPADIEGGAINAETAKTMPNSVGNAWAFIVWVKADRAREVRGWATPGGDVITPEQNLGLLLAEAGVWGRKRRQEQTRELAARLAGLIVWAYGMNHMVVNDPDIKIPVLELSDGDGALTFVSSYRAPGPGGAGGGPNTYTLNTVALTRDRKATLTKAPYNR
ncbi:MAG TPA: hypothetical protein VF507_06545 [Pyrinomonadaceae bacterium]|jgi:hypothetical protein